MHEKEQWINAIRDNSSETIASIILADIERIEKQEQEIKRLKSRLEEYQEYVEINHKEIERLNNIIKELEKTLLEWHEYWEDDDSYSWQYKNAYDYLQELKGGDKE